MPLGIGAAPVPSMIVPFRMTSASAGTIWSVTVECSVGGENEIGMARQFARIANRHKPTAPESTCLFKMPIFSTIGKRPSLQSSLATMTGEDSGLRVDVRHCDVDGEGGLGKASGD
jgi:hypothetical protein